MGVHPQFNKTYDSSCDSPLDEDEAQSRPFLSEDLEGAIKLQDRVDDGYCPSAARGDKTTPIPKAQLAVLCAVRLVDPIMFTQIFPYVNEMMDHLHLTDDPSKVGLFSGMVVSTPSLLPRTLRVFAQRMRTHRRAASPSRNCSRSTTGHVCLVRARVSPPLRSANVRRCADTSPLQTRSGASP